ncbi:hypothetical protein L195_g033520 [Trifolium pratense]|uniref:Uncharacterized protein n=1 Tax=Trifolium pratense TaxID=57577 RepID=A0A2K3LG89_TRIPR|nr:hypothetical protein L195_g033520 [Trifolium pratense]
MDGSGIFGEVDVEGSAWSEGEVVSAEFGWGCGLGVGEVSADPTKSWV